MIFQFINSLQKICHLDNNQFHIFIHLRRKQKVCFKRLSFTFRLSRKRASKIQEMNKRLNTEPHYFLAIVGPVVQAKQNWQTDLYVTKKQVSVQSLTKVFTSTNTISITTILWWWNALLTLSTRNIFRESIGTVLWKPWNKRRRLWSKI